eukprot:429232-Rhodomonas_salina.1
MRGKVSALGTLVVGHGSEHIFWHGVYLYTDIYSGKEENRKWAASSETRGGGRSRDRGTGFEGCISSGLLKQYVWHTFSYHNKNTFFERVSVTDDSWQPGTSGPGRRARRH